MPRKLARMRCPALVGSYQKALIGYWPAEGPGYSDAAQYISGEQVPANGDLLAMLLGRMPHPGRLQVHRP
jgi:hypothetical protein